MGCPIKLNTPAIAIYAINDLTSMRSQMTVAMNNNRKTAFNIPEEISDEIIIKYSDTSGLSFQECAKFNFALGVVFKFPMMPFCNLKYPAIPIIAALSVVYCFEEKINDTHWSQIDDDNV